MDELKIFIQNEIMSLAFVKVSFNESIVKSKLLDSITLIDLLVSIEEKIDKKIPQYLISDENMDSIDSIVAVISNL
jgi:acyl carrier protein